MPNFNDLINKPGQHSFSASYGGGTKNAPTNYGSGYSGGGGGYGGGGGHGSTKTAKQTEEFMLNELLNQLGK